MMVDPLYNISVKCTYCEESFTTPRVRPSFKKAVKTDTDFCVHYKDENPDFYVVRICPFCGFASTDSFSDRITPAGRTALKEKVADHWKKRDYCKERTREEALQCYKLALLCAQLKDEKDRVIAGILHHIAWLYRYKGEEEQEKRFLQFALDAYLRVYESEGMDLNNARLMYLLGELNRRQKHYNEAVKWFSRVIQDKRIVDAAMIRASREQWAVTRENILADKLELPEEMRQIN